MIDLTAILEKMTKKATKNRKNKKLNVNFHALYEQYEKRAQRSGNYPQTFSSQSPPK